MLSRDAIGAAHSIQLERGFEIERRSGTRAATTLTKLPNARAGGKTSRASATFTRWLSAPRGRWLSTVGLERIRLQMCFADADTSIEGTWHELRAFRPTSDVHQ